VAAYIAREPGLLRAFFNGSPRRVMLFFEHFSMSGSFTLGARALSRFAFANRCVRPCRRPSRRLRGSLQ
jgi:hypothetical protein